MNVYIKHLMALLLLLLFDPLIGQNNIVPFEPVTILKNTQFTRSFVGYQPQTIAKDHGTVNITGTKPNFTFTYTPDSGYVGKDTLIIQAQDSEDWFRHKLFYLSYVIEIVPSTVYAEQDYYTVQVNDSAVVFDILANDSTSLDTITIDQLPLVNNGSAAVKGQSLEFTPDTDYKGMAYINYVICDTLGACDNGAVTICVLDSNDYIQSDTINAVTKQDLELVQPLPATQYQIGDSAVNGNVEFLATDLVRYTPDEGYYGKDSFKLNNTDNGSHRFFRINILQRIDNRSTLIDDVVFTAIDHDVWIDVQANDVSDNFDVRTTRHPVLGTLVYVDSVELYRYTPPVGIESIEDFEYGLKGGRVTEKATGTIYINDGHPEAPDVEYVFESPVNTQFLLRYDLPFDEHEFTLVNNRTSGDVDVFNQDTTIEVECDSVTGRHMIRFDPGRNYVGPNRFTLEHCVTGTTVCREIDINVVTFDTTYGGCYCVDNCVWAGDINYDGRVNMKDLLPLAHHIGESGQSRTGATTDWDAQDAAEWARTIDGTVTDLKHADTDGNGILEENDTTAISENYYLEHGMVPELVGPSRKYAFYLEPRFDTVFAGELAVIDVVFGSDANPIEDMEGVAYTINFAPHVKYDSSTLKVTNSPASFLTFNSPYLDMYKQPAYRHVDVGIARTNGSVSHGNGIVSTLEFIVEEDLAGIRSESGYLPYKINLKNAVGMSGSGQTFALPDSEVTLYLNVGKQDLPFNVDRVTVWPNPNRGVVNVHLNGQEKMLAASLHSLDGKKIYTWNHIDPDHQRLVMDESLSGIYILRVETTAGAVAKKLHILNR